MAQGPPAVRTPEQVKADDALTDAILGVLTAYEWEMDKLLTDYLVVMVRQKFDDEGGQVSEYGYLTRDESIPDYRCIGLLESVRERFRARMMGIDQDDD